MLLKHKKTIILSTIIFIVFLLQIGYGYVSHKIVEQFPKNVNRMLPPYIHLNYEKLKPDICFMAACVSAQNVSLTLPTETPNSFSVFEFGNVQFKSNLLGNYTLNTNPPTSTKLHHPIQITISASGSFEKADIHNLIIRQNQFQATLTGTFSVKKQEIDLTGKAIYLTDFAQQFIPDNLQFLTSFLFKNNQQEITVSTDETWVYMMNLPILPKSMLFQKR